VFIYIKVFPLCPIGKWLRVVRGRRSLPSWHPLVAGGSACVQARLVKMVKVQ